MKLLFTYFLICFMCIAQTAFPQADEKNNAPISISGIVADAAGKPVAGLSISDDAKKNFGPY